MKNERNFFKIAYWGSISSFIVWLIFVVCFQPYNLPATQKPADTTSEVIEDLFPLDAEMSEIYNNVYHEANYNGDVLTEDQIIAEVKRAIEDRCPILVYIDTVERVEPCYGTEFYIDDYGEPLQIIYHEGSIGGVRVNVIDLPDSVLDEIVKEWRENKE